MSNSGMDSNEDQISNWKMEPRDCTEHRRKDQKGGKWNTEATSMEKRPRCPTVSLRGILDENKKRK